MAAQPYGLLLLASPRNAVVDIIFVHGLTGDRLGTWTHASRTFWPLHCLPDRFQQARIFTHGYNADVHSTGTGVIGDFARDLIHDILGRRTEDGTLDRPLIFIAHSLGGLVVKQALLTCLEDDAEAAFRTITTSVRGILFMGTPHKGSQVAVWGARLARAPSFFASFNLRILRELRSDATGLVRLQLGFERFLDRKGAALQVFCFIEENTYFRGQKIVDDDSATLWTRKHDRKFSHANHIEMTKFENAGEVGYSDVCDRLRRWMPLPSGELRASPSDDGPTQDRDAKIAALCGVIITLCARKMSMPEDELDTSETRQAMQDAVNSMLFSRSRPSPPATSGPAEPQVLYKDAEQNYVILRDGVVLMRYDGCTVQPHSLEELLRLAARALPQIQTAAQDRNTMQSQDRSTQVATSNSMADVHAGAQDSRRSRAQLSSSPLSASSRPRIEEDPLSGGITSLNISSPTAGPVAQRSSQRPQTARRPSAAPRRESQLQRSPEMMPADTARESYGRSGADPRVSALPVRLPRKPGPDGNTRSQTVDW
ncbi:hypothetical protein B0A48_04351 [Cryoendolithus antarcticus]|uniref:DUF676 domain-containing protein n=1 Tax=Cryoendolithus antarcticus TaxID=1507870 RepID=A0A1V8TF40_9PEZI|nr:hypothetical protein B0A48_04351 [Cryoendolithus antarcticus]